jgi:hypothetical protein
MATILHVFRKQPLLASKYASLLGNLMHGKSELKAKLGPRIGLIF